MTKIEAVYRWWLIDRVFLRGWSTLKCAREIGADPASVQRDVDEILWAERKRRFSDV